MYKINRRGGGPKIVLKEITHLRLKIALPHTVSPDLQEHQYQTDWRPLTSLEHRPLWPAEDRPPYLPKLTYSPFWNITDIYNFL